MGESRNEASTAHGAEYGRSNGSKTNITDITSESGDTEPELDDIFDLLRNRRRRAVLQYLDSETDGTTTLDELAEHIAAKENGIDVSQLSSQQQKRVHIGLYQCHLPRMDKLGVIEYNQSRGTIVLRDIERLRPYLFKESEVTSIMPFYVGLGLIAINAIGILTVGASAIVPVETWGLVSIVALGFLLVYYRQNVTRE